MGFQRGNQCWRLVKKHISGMKGKKHSEETKRRMREIHKGKPNVGWFHKGQPPLKYWLGRKMLKEHRMKLSETKKGEGNPNWKGGIQRIKQPRNNLEYKKWRIVILKRDNFTCVSCKEVKGELEAHHIKGWAEYPTLRFDIDNGITLCRGCHSLTDKYRSKWRKQ